MSRIEKVVHAYHYDRPISYPLQYLPCGRCHGEIEYGQGTEWSIVNKLANEHWEACPGRPHARLAHMARTPTSSLDSNIALFPPVASGHRNNSNSIAGGSPNNSWTSSGCERKRKNIEQRKLELEQDEYAEGITAKSVVCGGCHKEISLDKRSKYYPGLWRKHKSKCPSIEKRERSKAKVLQAPDSSRHTPRDVVTPALSENSYGDMQHPSLTERYQSRNTAVTHLLVRHRDSDDLSSGDEDEDGDFPPQESFPILNHAFYWAQRHDKPETEWVYRYSTKDEITANLFRGQNEPYARASIRPFTRPTPQTGDYCETMYCVGVITSRV